MAHDRDKGDLVVLSREALVDKFHFRIVPGRRQRRHVEDIARPAPAAADMPGALGDAAVARERRNPDQGCGLAPSMVPSSGIQQHSAAAVICPIPGTEVRI